MGAATIVSWVPMKEMTSPMNSSRKLRESRSGLKSTRRRGRCLRMGQYHPGGPGVTKSGRTP
jgi:hypothetical protein